MATYGKKHQPESISFDGLVALAFDAITLQASQASTAIQGSIPVPGNFKVFFIGANLTGSPAGTCSINVCAGTAAEAGVGTKDTALTTGQQLLASDQALTMTANQNQRFQAAVPDAFLSGSGTLVFTLRTVTNGSAAGTLKVTLYGKFGDPNPTKPLYDSSGNLTF
jgi:hypothetical protein